jgi:site-specific recombinase XerD
MALRSFFKHALRNDPAHAEQYVRILSVASKKTQYPICTYLEPEEVKVLLAQPSQQTKLGIRDYALLLFLYNTGARVSEALGVTLGDLHLNPPRQVRLRGKGKKERICPLWTETAAALKRLILPAAAPGSPIFLNYRNEPLTRHGVLQLLYKYSSRAAKTGNFPGRRLHPHVLRHYADLRIMPRRASEIEETGRKVGFLSPPTRHSFWGCVRQGAVGCENWTIALSKTQLLGLGLV